MAAGFRVDGGRGGCRNYQCRSSSPLHSAAVHRRSTQGCLETAHSHAVGDAAQLLPFARCPEVTPACWPALRTSAGPGGWSWPGIVSLAAW